MIWVISISIPALFHMFASILLLNGVFKVKLFLGFLRSYDFLFNLIDFSHLEMGEP